MELLVDPFFQTDPADEGEVLGAGSEGEAIRGMLDLFGFRKRLAEACVAGRVGAGLDFFYF